MILPSKLQLKIWLLITLIAIGANAVFVALDWQFSLFTDFLAVVFIIWLIILVSDVPINYLHNGKVPLQISREVAEQLSVGKTSIAKLHILNTSSKLIYAKIADLLPETFISDVEITEQTLGAHTSNTFSYPFTPMHRGSYQYKAVQLRTNSNWRLWQVDSKIECENVVKVYPDFSAFSNHGPLIADLSQQVGIITKQQKRGSGTDFSELREYRAGDALYQIDYKATSKFNHLISREYQIERDQQVILMLDCSRRMRVLQDGFSHFDYALNSVVYLARTILQQGDSVGFMSFGNTASDAIINDSINTSIRSGKFCPPKKGRNNINYLLNQIYDLEPSLLVPDYVQAAEELLMNQRRRSLVILMTNLREEDSDAISRMHQLISKKHLLVIANLAEETLTKSIDIADFNDATYYAARDIYYQQRNNMLNKLRKERIMLLDTNPKNLSPNLINLYLNIKQSGVF